MKYNADLLFMLLLNLDCITFKTKVYNGYSNALQVNNDKTFQYNFTSNLTNTIVTELNKKDLESLYLILINKGYSIINPIDYN